MSWQFSAEILPLGMAAALAFVLCFFAARNQGERAATEVVGVLLGASIWTGADALRLASTELSTKVVLHNVRFVGSTLVVLSALLFALEYTNRDRWAKRRVAAALGVPFLGTLALVWTDHTAVHDLVRTSAELVVTDSLVLATFEFGPAFYLNAAYSYALLGIALALYATEYVRAQGQTYRRQCAMLVVGLLVPWAINALYVGGITVVDYTGFGLVVTGITFYASLFWFELLDLGPIARSTVVEEIEHGFVVVDTDGRIVDVNATAAEMIGRSRGNLIGTDAETVRNAPADLVDRLTGDELVQDEVTVPVADGKRHFTVDVSPVTVANGRHAGHVVLIRDVTERRRRQRALEQRTEQLEAQTRRLQRQNEQLDRFASIVSHDLRNPLTVACGYLEEIDADTPPDPDHVEAIEEALDRMEEIIEDVRTLVRQEQESPNLESVDLESVATRAWEQAVTRDGSIVVDADATVRGDRSRLQQLFENLFRNAVDHGPDDVTVCVGELPDGFYVADDGPGIPEDEQDQVFDEGYTTADDGTGLGLSIVSSIVETLDWSIRVTESDDGGTRFEVTGVDDARQSGLIDGERV